MEFGEAIRVTICDEEYDIYIEGPYPFQAPKLYKVPKGLVFQGDLLEAFLKKPWTQGFTLKHIVTSPACSLPGTFTLGHTFPLYLFENLSYPCVSLNPSTYKTHQKLEILITSSHLFQIESFDGSKNGYLVAYATIESIKQIKISTEDRYRFTIIWRGTVDYLQVFKSNKCQEIVERIFQVLQDQSVRLTKLKIDRKFINEDDVTPQYILRVKIKDIEAEINELELELEFELVKNKINALIQFYQKAIEYYSALGDDKFDMYLGKMRNLMGNSEVLAVLMEETHTIIVNNVGLIKELEDQEIWPVNLVE